MCVCGKGRLGETKKEEIITFAVVRRIITHLYAFRLMQLIPRLQQERVNPGRYSRGLR